MEEAALLVSGLIYFDETDWKLWGIQVVLIFQS